MRQLQVAYQCGFKRLLRTVFVCALLLSFVIPVMAGDGAISGKSGNISIIYGITAAVALLLLIGYCHVVKQRDFWFVILYIAVFVVNLGYFALSISRSLGEAMLANRISYLGSVFLPLAMLMIIMNVCQLRCNKIFMGFLIVLSAGTFLLAASGGYLDLYYKEVSVEIVGGVAVLKKVYGPLHGWYLIYLISYFAMMVGCIIHSFILKRISSCKHVLILLSLVLGNITVWYVEQLIDWNFEFLSVTYLITELFLLLLYDMLQDYSILQQARLMVEGPGLTEGSIEMPPEDTAKANLPEQRIRQILSESPAVELLTGREREVLEYLLQDLPRREIAERLYVTENTVKKHTSNIFSKLEVSNRRELFARLDSEIPAAR